LAGQVAVREPLTAAEQASALTLETDAPQALERLLETIRAIGEEP
jgi:hypothetical protein